jgi:hypothetical protein
VRFEEGQAHLVPEDLLRLSDVRLRRPAEEEGEFVSKEIVCLADNKPCDLNKRTRKCRWNEKTEVEWEGRCDLRIEVKR